MTSLYCNKPLKPGEDNADVCCLDTLVSYIWIIVAIRLHPSSVLCFCLRLLQRSDLSGIFCTATRAHEEQRPLRPEHEILCGLQQQLIHQHVFKTENCRHVFTFMSPINSKPLLTTSTVDLICRLKARSYEIYTRLKVKS